MKLVVIEDAVTPEHLRNLVFAEAARASVRVRMYSKHDLLSLEVDTYGDRTELTLADLTNAGKKKATVPARHVVVRNPDVEAAVIWWERFGAGPRETLTQVFALPSGEQQVEGVGTVQVYSAHERDARTVFSPFSTAYSPLAGPKARLAKDDLISILSNEQFSKLSYVSFRSREASTLAGKGPMSRHTVLLDLIEDVNFKPKPKLDGGKLKFGFTHTGGGVAYYLYEVTLKDALVGNA